MRHKANCSIAGCTKTSGNRLGGGIEGLWASYALESGSSGWVSIGAPAATSAIAASPMGCAPDCTWVATIPCALVVHVELGSGSLGAHGGSVVAVGVAVAAAVAAQNASVLESTGPPSALCANSGVSSQHMRYLMGVRPSMASMQRSLSARHARNSSAKLRGDFPLGAAG